MVQKTTAIYGKLGTFADVVTFKPRSGPSFRTDPELNGITVLIPSVVTNFEVDISKVEYGLGFEKINDKDILEPSIILIVRGNKPAPFGNAGAVPEEARIWACANLLMRTKVDTTTADSHFCVYWLRFPFMKRHVRKNMKGANSSIKKRNQKDVLHLPFPTSLHLTNQKLIVVKSLDFLAIRLTRYP